jgi:sensor domain CHASE-containing protein
MSALRFFYRRLRRGGRALFAALALFLASIALLVYADNWYADQLLLEQQAATREEIRGYGRSMAADLNSNLSRLQGLLSFVSLAEDGAEMWADFQEFAAGLYLGTEGIRYLAVAPNGIVQHVFTPDGGQPLLGQDLAQDLDPEVRAAVERATTSDKPILAGPVTFPDGRLGLIGTRAVFRDDRYWGLVQIALDLETIFDDPNIRPATSPLELALRDNQGQVFLGSYTLFARDPTFIEVAVGEERWTLAGIPKGGWEAAIRDELLLARVGGLLIAGLLATVVYLTVDRQQRLTAAVGRRTRELAEAHQLLEERVKERTRQLQTGSVPGP